MKKLLVVLVSIFVVGAVNAQIKVAYINSNKVLDTLPSRKAAIKELTEFNAAAEKELTDLDNELQKAYEKYVKESGTLSQVLKQYEEERLQKMQANIQAREQELQERIQRRSNDLNAPILKILQTAVENVSVRQKLNYVLDESQLLYSKGGTDITNEVINEALKLDVKK